MLSVAGYPWLYTFVFGALANTKIYCLKVVAH